MWFLGLVGCSDWFLRPDTSETAPVWEAVEETFVQRSGAKVDMLLVIDDTASMAQEQGAIAATLAPWLAALDALGLSWQLGVVSTEMEIDEAGWLRGTPYVLSPDTVDRDLVFAQMVDVGTHGLGVEAGLAAAITALDLAVDGPNAGFRRLDAALHVLFISDTDDQSDLWLDMPVAEFLHRLDGEAAGTGLAAQASAIVGPEPSGCSSAVGSAQPGGRYIDIAGMSGGAVVDICAPRLDDVEDVIAAQARAGSTTFALDRTPVDGSLRVQVDGVESVGWALDGDRPAIVFDAPPEPGSLISARYLVEVER